MVMKSEFLRSQCSLNAHCGTSAANPAIFTIISEYLAWLWSSLCWINADLLYLDAHFTDATPCSGKLCGKQAGAGGARLISWQSRSTDSNKLEDSGVESWDEVCAAAGFAPWAEEQNALLSGAARVTKGQWQGRAHGKTGSAPLLAGSGHTGPSLGNSNTRNSN